MRPWHSRALALVAILFAVMTVAAQEPRDRDEEPPKGHDMPQRKGMMGPGMMGGGMMPMMMQMHQQQAALAPQWEATGDGVFVLRADRLMKYDNDLKLVKTVELPGHHAPMMPRHAKDADDADGRPKMPMMGMAHMMAQMHGALPARLAVTPDAVFVSRGSHLLKFSRDLKLQNAVDLSESKAMACPMCGHMMEK